MSGKHRLIILILIMAAVGGIWWMKNPPQGDPAAVDDSEFALHVVESFDLQELKSHGLPIMIDFGADYCPPCRAMAPILEELNVELRGKAIIKYVDVEKLPQLAADYPVRVIPTQVFFDHLGNPFFPADPESLGMLLYTITDTDEHVLTAHEGGLNKEQILAVLAEMGMER